MKFDILKNRTQIYNENLCKEIILTANKIMMNYNVFHEPYVSESKYKFSRAKWYEASYDWKYYTEVIEWCEHYFGPHPKHADAWSRWHDKYNGSILFRDEKDYEWFMLRWS
jgi:hypothetical protein